MKKRILIYSLLVVSIVTLAYAGARFNFIKTSFNAGEFSPSIYGRTDLEKYNNGAITMKNFIPIAQGGVTRRPGFEYIADAKYDNQKVRLIPFQFSDEQSYIVECGVDYMRYYMNGGQIITPDASTALLLHMNGDDASTTFTDDGNTGHTVTANGDAQIDTAYKKFGTGSGLFDGTGDYLSIPDSADWNFGADKFTIDFWWRLNPNTYPPVGTSKVYPVFQQYVDADNYIAFYLTHSDDSPTSEIFLRIYIRESGAYLFLGYYQLSADPSGWNHIALIRGWGGDSDSWMVTTNGVAVGSPKTETDSMPDLAATFDIGRAYAISTTTTEYIDGRIEEFRVSKGVARWTANFTPPDRQHPISVAGGGTIYEDTSTGYLESELDYLKWAQSYDTMYIVHPDQSPAKLTRADHDDWTLTRVSFTETPSEWNATNGWPRAVTFHQDRLVLAGSPAYPPRFWFSQLSDYENLTTGVEDDDGFTITLLSGSVDTIYWLESQRRLVAGSNSGEWWLSGDGTDLAITPTSKQAQNDTKFGSIDHQPVNIGNAIIMAQAPGTRIREMIYDFDTDSYNSNDITILADHILKGYSIKQMAYQQAPYQIVWVLRSDGTLFALTYMKEHEVVGWSEMETDGEIISIATIPGEPEDELWLVVNRTINGTIKTYIERMKDFEFNTLADAFMVDSGLTYDGALTSTISGITHLKGETVDILADGRVESTTVAVFDDLPTGNGLSTAFNDDGSLLAVAHTTSPYVTIYNVPDFNKVDNPSTLPAGVGRGAAFNNDGSLLAVAHTTSPYITIYNTSDWSKVDNPSTLPTSHSFGAAFNNDGSLLAVAHTTTPYITIYNTSDWSKVTNPGTLPTGNGLGVAFNDDGSLLAVAHTTTPYITIYNTSDWSKVDNPSTLPTGTGYGVAFNDDGSLLAVAHDTSPYITIYNTSDWSKVDNPSTLPAGVGRGAAFNNDGSLLAVAHTTTPYITIYNTSDWSKVDNPSNLPASVGYGVAFNDDGSLMSVVYTAADYVNIYNTNSWGKIASGNIVLDASAELVHIGMPYDSDLQTMYVSMDMDKMGSSMFMKKRIPTVNFRVRDSAGGSYGKDESNLVDLLPDTALYSGDITNKSVNMGWTRNASIYVRQDDPLPMTIDAMVMEVEFGN